MRRGIVVPILYTLAKRGPARSIVTVRTAAGSFSFQPVDLRDGPMLASEYGFFIRDQATKIAEAPMVPPVLPAKDLLKDQLSDGAACGWGTKETPVIYVNTSNAPLSLLNGAIVVPPHAVVAHPGASHDIAIGWQSPLTGKVNLKARLAKGHKCGDGVDCAGKKGTRRSAGSSAVDSRRQGS